MTTSQINSALRSADNAEKAVLDEADALDSCLIWDVKAILLSLASAVRTMAPEIHPIPDTLP